MLEKIDQWGIVNKTRKRRDKAHFSKQSNRPAQKCHLKSIIDNRSETDTTEKLQNRIKKGGQKPKSTQGHRVKKSMKNGGAGGGKIQTDGVWGITRRAIKQNSIGSKPSSPIVSTKSSWP